MTRCQHLRQEAALVSGHIDRRAWYIYQRTDTDRHQVRALARGPAALPVAFASGMLDERLRVPDIKYAYGLLAGQVKAM